MENYYSPRKSKLKKNDKVQMHEKIWFFSNKCNDYLFKKLGLLRQKLKQY